MMVAALAMPRLELCLGIGVLKGSTRSLHFLGPSLTNDWLDQDSQAAAGIRKGSYAWLCVWRRWWATWVGGVSARGFGPHARA